MLSAWCYHFDGSLMLSSLDDAAHTMRIVRTHARTFWLASHFLPTEKRRAAYALYAFCRVADDVVDEATSGGGQEAAPLLHSYRRRLDTAIAGNAEGPVLRELMTAVATYGIPTGALYELLDGIARDCGPVRYATWEDLATYCEGVASSVGEMCAAVFGVSQDPVLRSIAVRHARTLGVAMQLTNILRDVGEDAQRGRCYLPEDDLARFGLARADVLSERPRIDDRWKAFMAFEIQRAKSLYAASVPGISMLDPDSRRCAAACAFGYEGILSAIERIGYDTFRVRARPSSLARAAVLWTVWRSGARGAQSMNHPSAVRLA